MTRSSKKHSPHHILEQFEGYHPDRQSPVESEPAVVDGLAFFAIPEHFPDGARLSSWASAGHGPEPRPDWVITDLGATDRELGIIKTGKEADVFLVERTSLDHQQSTLMAAKRYRASENRTFHRDAAYQEGRRVRRSREGRAMARRTEFGRDLLSSQWSYAEFDMLSLLWNEGVPVPYPVQIDGTEILMEFIGSGRAAAPRLAAVRPDPDELRSLWDQTEAAIRFLARIGYAHGDLSPYNILVEDGSIYLIDLPQVIDVVINPRGPDFLHRDIINVADWFIRRGMVELDPELIYLDLAGEANIGN